MKFNGLLFIPSSAPINLFSPELESGVKLYSKDNLILERCEEILPDYLKFIKGIIDSPDFSLNISREMLQTNKQLRIIGKNIEKVILRRLKKLLKDDRDKYESFWSQFGKAIKGGLYSNPGKKDKLEELLLFSSSHVEDGLTTLAQYVERMSEEQDVIYYVVGENRKTIENLPQMEITSREEFRGSLLI